MTPKEILLSLAMQQGGSGGGGYPEPTGTKQITITENGTTTEDVKDYAAAEINVDVPTYPEPTGTRQIALSRNNNTTTVDVKDYANAAITVAVPEPSGTDTITLVSNGTVTMDVKDYAYAAVTVAVPEPTGTKNITVTQNGAQDVDVTNYETARVNVNVQPSLGTLVATEPGTYIAADDEYDGYSTVEVQTSGGDISQYQNVLSGVGFSIEDDGITKIRSRAFSMIDNYDDCVLALANCVSLGTYAFENSSFNSLKVSLPLCEEVANGAFANCQAQVKTALELPSLTASLAYGNFNGCSAFHTIDIGEGLTYIGNNVFKDVTANVVLRRTTSKVTLGNTSAFNGFSGIIYVPDSMVSDYQTATNWSTYASLIQPLSNYTPV